MEGLKDKMNKGNQTITNAYNGSTALVIGGSIAGLISAQVLASSFSRVIIIDRDRLGVSSAFRHGTPQSQQVHTLLPQGQSILEKLFPGISQELFTRGAISIDPGRDVAFFQNGAWRKPRPQSQCIVSSSRPLLEQALYNRVEQLANVSIISNHEVTGVRIDPQIDMAVGVNIRRRGGFPYESALAADLILDTSGRSSAAFQWLSSQGYPTPNQTVVDAHAGYASRIYAQPKNSARSWKTLYVRPSAPSQDRGGVILPLEGNRWHVALMGLAGDYPPNDPDGFLSFARSLPVPDFFAAIRDARPLSKIYGFRRTETRIQHFDQLSRQPHNLLFLGDSVYILNPVYAMGMTAAAIGGLALQRVLADRTALDPQNMNGLAMTFQKRLSRDLARNLQLVMDEDMRWSSTQVTFNGQFVGSLSTQPALQPA